MKKVLCVDDSPTMANIIENIVKKNFSNITVKRLLDSTEVEKELEKDYYDLLITDINMPKLNGYELVKQIRSIPANKSLKIMAVSSEGGKSSIVKMLKIGADSFVIKPFTKEEIVKKINDLLYSGSALELRKEELFLKFLHKMKTDFVQNKKIDTHDQNLISEFVNKIKNNMHTDENLKDFWGR